MQSRQKGLTAIGWLVMLVPVAIVLYGGIRVVPVYLNYYKVAQVIDQVASEASGGEATSAGQIRNAIERRFDIESISFPTVQDVHINRDGASWVIEASYEQTAPLFANVSLLLSFERIARAE